MASNVSSSEKQKISVMSIKASSSLSMDAQGLILSVKQPANGNIGFRFLGINGGCRVYIEKAEGEEVSTDYVESSPLCQLAKEVDRFCESGIGFGKIIVDIPKWYFENEEQDVHKIVSCRELVVHSDEERSIIHWINRIDGGLESLDIKPAMNVIFRKFNKPSHLSREFAELPLFKSIELKELIMMHWVPFTDEEFLSFRVPFFEIMSETISENAINQYIHMWVTGVLQKSERFGISFDRPIEQCIVLRGLLVVPWDDTFEEKFPDIVYNKTSETKYTVFREKKEGELSVGTLCFTSDYSWYFDLGNESKKYEEELNKSQREKAFIAP